MSTHLNGVHPPAMDPFDSVLDDVMDAVAAFPPTHRPGPDAPDKNPANSSGPEPSERPPSWTSGWPARPRLWCLALCTLAAVGWFVLTGPTRPGDGPPRGDPPSPVVPALLEAAPVAPVAPRSASPEPDESSAKRLALLVGCGQYSGNKSDRRSFAHRDTAAIAAILAARGGYSPDVMIDSTASEIRDRLREMLKAVSPNDSVVVFLSGHGMTDPTDIYFCPKNATPTAGSTDSLVSISAVLRDVGQSRAGTKLVIVGTAFTAAQAPSPAAAERLQRDCPADVTLLAAFWPLGSKRETVPAGRSRFGEALVAALGRSKMEPVTMAQLIDHVRSQYPGDEPEKLPFAASLPDPQFIAYTPVARKSRLLLGP